MCNCLKCNILTDGIRAHYTGYSVDYSVSIPWLNVTGTNMYKQKDGFVGIMARNGDELTIQEAVKLAELSDEKEITKTLLDWLEKKVRGQIEIIEENLCIKFNSRYERTYTGLFLDKSGDLLASGTLWADSLEEARKASKYFQELPVDELGCYCRSRKGVKEYEAGRRVKAFKWLKEQNHNLLWDQLMAKAFTTSKQSMIKQLKRRFGAHWTSVVVSKWNSQNASDVTKFLGVALK